MSLSCSKKRKEDEKTKRIICGKHYGHDTNRKQLKGHDVDLTLQNVLLLIACCYLTAILWSFSLYHCEAAIQTHTQCAASIIKEKNKSEMKSHLWGFVEKCWLKYEVRKFKNNLNDFYENFIKNEILINKIKSLNFWTQQKINILLKLSTAGHFVVYNLKQSLQKNRRIIFDICYVADNVSPL